MRHRRSLNKNKVNKSEFTGHVCMDMVYKTGKWEL